MACTEFGIISLLNVELLLYTVTRFICWRSNKKRLSVRESSHWIATWIML